MENSKKFGKSHFQARLYAFAWTILETRDKEFDAEKNKQENWLMLVLKATGFASKEECEVMTEMIGLISSKPDVNDELGDMMAALEGKKVVYDNMDPRVLLEEKDVF